MVKMVDVTFARIRDQTLGEALTAMVHKADAGLELGVEDVKGQLEILGDALGASA